jgi:DNA-binding IclR family transcriptional regulator
MDADRDRHVKSAETMFNVLGVVHTMDQARVTDVSDRLGIAKSTAHGHLQTLVKHEFILKSEEGIYSVGLKCLWYGMQAKHRMEFPEVVRPWLKQLAEETNEISWVMVEEYGKGVYLEKAEGKYAVQPYGEVGKRVPLHNIASGKAILSELPEERVREIVAEQGLEPNTERTIDTIEQLLEELGTIRERGYAMNDGEVLEGFRAVASPIVHDGNLLGAITVSGPENRLRSERFRESLPEKVTGTANAIELSLSSQ